MKNEDLKKIPPESAQHESICRRCGICCGSDDGDPCVQLRQNKKGEFHCAIYSERFGLRKTVKGNFFMCIPIERALKNRPELKEICAYARVPKNAQIKL
jgi:hypothetical protein